MPAAKKNIIALDVGEKRIGVALADAELKLPRPLRTLAVSTEVTSQLKQLLEEYQVATVVIGYPRNQDGSPTQQTRQIETFVKQLGLDTSIEITWQDESLTSVQARTELADRGKPYTKPEIDALAATYILQDYLQEHL